MQKQWSIAGCLALVALTSTGVNYWQIGQINSFRLQEKISQAENRLLKDQINELEFKSRVKKICPYIFMKIDYQCIVELDKVKSNHYFSHQQNIELFGEAKRERLTI